ncbi:MAG: glycoside hydrolase family 127 protein [Verrucomicrobiae bacterium]|nr:glycoside hydrolase family 127 protein [Verrucomicrobiae bacterium]
MKTTGCFWAAGFAGIIAFVAPTVGTAQGTLAKLRAVPFTDVKITDAFWSPRQETNRIASIPVNLENLEKAGNLENFRLAAKGAREGYQGPVFMDSDAYKALEAASYSLATHPDPALDARLDEIIATLAAAQQPDGYLNTYFIVKEPTKRWTNLRDWHELYCAGHLFEAAVAHYQATGKRSFLNVAIKLADNLDSVFGSPPKRMGYPGHPETELALIKLWRVTGERRYFELARFFVENRGRKFFAEEHKTPLDRYDGSYWQDDVPIYQHRNIKGHAVRAAYLMSGTTDVAAETGDERLLTMLNRVWRNTTERNMYLTGGIGPSAHNEGFTVDYDLPNATAYQETCATVALAQWGHRLALLYGDAKYADVVERALYNGVLAGVSQDGTKFFYVNPLESAGRHHRQPWFGCACCPPNVARTIASLGGYAYAVSDDALWVNLYIQGSVKAKVAGIPVELKVTTDYPWDGKVVIEPVVKQPTSFELRLRLPAWCETPSLLVNGRRISPLQTEQGYLVVKDKWKRGDKIELNLPMPVQRMAANPNVKANHGLLAIQRGPLVYCLEQCDQSEPLAAMFVPAGAELKPEKQKSLLGGVVAIKGMAEIAEDQNWRRTLYQPANVSRRVPFQAIPYYAWDNRQAGAMKVWLPTAPLVPPVGGLEAEAKVTMSFANDNCQPQGVNDGIEPKSSGEQPAANCHWWPRKGTEEWVQYTWSKPVTVTGTKAYWFDDTGRGQCRIPVSWRIQFLDGQNWKPVAAKGNYSVAKDKWCEVEFEPVQTAALRLVVKLQDGWSTGVHEWKVMEAEEQ